MSEFKPGTVAVATVRGVPNIRVFRSVGALSTCVWSVAEGIPHTRLTEDSVTDVRPLVVLDLDDPYLYGCSAVVKDPAKIVAALRDTNSVAAHGIARQIEAQTTPPRIPEPSMYGVVSSEDDCGLTTYFWHSPHGGWHGESGSVFEWADLPNPVLVRDGIEGGAK